MSLKKLTDCRIFADEYDLSSDVNKVEVAGERPALDATTFASAGWEESLAGLKSVSMNIGGFYDAALIDAAINDLDQQSSCLMSFAEDDAAGSIAYISQGPILSATRGFEVGQIAAMNVTAKATGAASMARGTLLLPRTTATSTASSTAQQVGAVLSTQIVYCALHVFAASGTTPTLDVKLQSDTVGFPSATDRITFTQATAVGAQLSSVAGAITDDYWRVNYTIGGGSPSFSFAVVMAIITP